MIVGNMVRITRETSAFYGRLGQIVQEGTRHGTWVVRLMHNDHQPASDGVVKKFHSSALKRVPSDAEASMILQQHLSLALREVLPQTPAPWLNRVVERVQAAIAEASVEIQRLD